MIHSYEIDYDLNPSFIKSLLCQAHNTEFINYVGASSGSSYDLKIASSAKHITKTPTISYMMNNIINPDLNIEGCVYLHFEPNKKIPPHVDDSLKRTSCITWALFPDIENFAPVIFYDENGNEKDKVYYTNKPLILNTRYRHGVQNNNSDRYSFQLCLNNPIEELVELDKENKLLKSGITNSVWF